MGTVRSIDSARSKTRRDPGEVTGEVGLTSTTGHDLEFTPDELANRAGLIDALHAFTHCDRHALRLAGEPRLPLVTFLTDETCDYLEIVNCEPWGGIDVLLLTDDDLGFARFPHMSARDVFDARLARAGLVTGLLNLAVVCEQESTGTWDTAVLLTDMFPPGVDAWDVRGLAGEAQAAARELARRLHAYDCDEYPSRHLGDDLLLLRAASDVQDAMVAAGMNLPMFDLTGDMFFPNGEILNSLFQGPPPPGALTARAGTLADPLTWFEPSNP